MLSFWVQPKCHTAHSMQILGVRGGGGGGGGESWEEALLIPTPSPPLPLHKIEPWHDNHEAFIY